MQNKLHKVSVWITALALPAGGTEDGVSRLLIALRLAPHALFSDPFQSDRARLRGRRSAAEQPG